MSKFCTKCDFVDKKEQRCLKYDKFLPVNIYGELFKCHNCLEEEITYKLKNEEE